MSNLAIIADDLTGANDSGVQLARHGLQTAVLFDLTSTPIHHYAAIVVDTDSRSIASAAAYQRVRQMTQQLLSAQFTTIFKKIDSTMRGNIGAELDALYDVLQPDFMMIAPSYPQNERIVKQSVHYVANIPLAESAAAQDPKTPVTCSHLPSLLQQQTSKSIGTITLDDLHLGSQHIATILNQYNKQNTPYIIIDATNDSHLQSILTICKKLPYRFVWAGSAGIANHLPDFYNIPAKSIVPNIQHQSRPSLTIIGSIHQQTRDQLEQLIKQPNIITIPLTSYKVVADQHTAQQEIANVYDQVYEQALKGHDIVIYSTGTPADVTLARQVGEQSNLSFTETSNKIVEALGNVGAKLLQTKLFGSFILSGGDTAKQLCKYAQIDGFELIDELESGVPIGRFINSSSQEYVITKSGGFGSNQILVQAIKTLRGERY
ncbi:four-carbon acid sugar kinase family protein [Paenibacillus yanchengensis]|uniref:Four-carbon acid sugar kinase family protein n=1 Tax=Paenibacillus yanchengensis TaxID=2035833 RepID=A0ABW4YP00_9BACL